MEISSLINEIVYALIIVILPIITKYAINALKTFSDKQIMQTSGYMKECIYKAENIVEDIVVSLNQTIVETTKRNGKWNSEVAKEVKDEAVKKGYELICDSTKQVICDTYNSFDKWLDVQIEKNVNANK